MNPYIPVAPQGIDPSLAVGITNPGGPNPMEGNVLLCSVCLQHMCLDADHVAFTLPMWPYVALMLLMWP